MEKQVVWSPSYLRHWREQMMGWTQTQAAEALGITLRAYQDREAGKARITRETGLACLWLRHQWVEMRATPTDRSAPSAEHKCDQCGGSGTWQSKLCPSCLGTGVQGVAMRVPGDEFEVDSLGDEPMPARRPGRPRKTNQP